MKIVIALLLLSLAGCSASLGKLEIQKVKICALSGCEDDQSLAGE